MKQWKLMAALMAAVVILAGCTSSWAPVQRTEGEDTYHVNEK